MTKTEKYLLITGGVLALIFIPQMAFAPTYQVITDWLIPSFEGFRPTPYWDISRYSWGYGTQAPGPTGTITKDKALRDMREVVNKDYAYLKPLVTRPLSANQWAAYLSFAYNLGLGNADNLLPNINSGNDDALETQWKQYVHSGGQVNDTLVNRRQNEWLIWTGQL